jgi:hypothetical protein
LRRFDKDGDGNIDLEEWETARQAAARQAATENTAQAAGQQLHMMSRPAAGRLPYLLSTQAEFALVKKFRLISAASATLFMAAGTICVWMIKARFLG